MPGADRQTGAKPQSWRRTVIGWGLLLAGLFTIQTVAAKPYYIPSGSMMPTLVKGDRLIVAKYPYGISYASPPLNLTGFVPGRLLGRMPERGDIVLVTRRGDGEVLIKRVIGLPGDTLAVREGVVMLNGRAVPREARGEAMLPIDANLTCDGPVLARRRTIAGDGKPYCRVPIFRETLPNGARYDTIDLGASDLGDGYFSPNDNYGPVTVPAAHLFLMGDNRDQSADSRVALERGGLGGPVPWESIGGRAELITHSFNGSGSLNPLDWFRAGRAGTSLRPEKHPAK